MGEASYTDGCFSYRRIYYDGRTDGLTGWPKTSYTCGISGKLKTPTKYTDPSAPISSGWSDGWSDGPASKRGKKMKKILFRVYFEGVSKRC